MKQLDYIQSKILERDTTLVETIEQVKKEGKKIVFTNGCFDIIHRGHVEYLAKARDKGDFMVLGLNTDASVQRLKGPTRPLQDEHTRALVLAAFTFIDCVVYFDEDTPLALISEIIPDVLVKGADYKPEDIVGYDIVTQNGGSVATIEFVQGHSSTNVINKMVN
ncbi:D-glycero-beta-D-manno-heptose 1-phosphate adenylyltransferase [Bacteroidales bacterium]|nr:D-glycero-beta-D-manno-heptose 1-phosphate adenylyltransferase [Bacteroidales bacterium]